MSFTLGYDVEVFLMAESGNPLPACGLVPGTKWEPARFPFKTNKGHTIQCDNVALEIGVPYAVSRVAWNNIVNNSNRYAHKYVLENLRLGGISSVASWEFEDEELTHPDAWVFGCEPDINAWTGEINPKPHAAEPNLRSCGGHVHIGIPNMSSKDKFRLIQLLDYYLGFPLSLSDPDRRRQQLYGKPGAMRFKPYGVEYRTPSNWWWVSGFDIYPMVLQAVEAFKDNKVPRYLNKIQEALLNPSDRDLRKHLSGAISRGAY